MTNVMKPRMDLFRTIETIFVPGWICFVPLKLFLCQTGTKIVSIVRRSIRVFLCFRGVQLEAHRTFFTPKMSQNLYCVPLVAHHEWDCFVLLKLFLYQLVQKKFH